LAPSPTGGLHLGNARTFLLTWLAARSVGGRLLLRIEDIDSPRIKAGAMADLQTDLAWLGLDWDGSPTVQTQRLPLYESALARLQAAERVFPCTCSRTDILHAASAPHAEHEGPIYPGTCAGRSVADARHLTKPFAWRYRTTHIPAYVDGVRGPTQVAADLFGGAFVVWKSAGTPAYQLAVVVDDAAQGVTHVLRGDDLVPSTPRQLLLYAELGHAPPEFAHVPLLVGTDGQRLAKRHGATRLAQLRSAGVTPAQLIGYLAWTCGWLARPEPLTLAELLPQFDLQRVPRTPWVLTAEQLAALA
jgi:glutamyl-tRNA synthetase